MGADRPTEPNRLVNPFPERFSNEAWETLHPSTQKIVADELRENPQATEKTILALLKAA